MAMILSVALMLTGTPLTVFAEAAGCNHTQHNAECAYVEGVPCGHIGGDACGEDEESCAHDDGCGYIEAAPCRHQHDASCGGLVDSNKTLGKSGEESEPIIVAEFDELDEYTEWQGYAYGTVTRDDLDLPDTLTGTDENGEPVTIEGVTWESEPEFDPFVSIGWPGYIFSPVLPQGYILVEGAEAPVITVNIWPEDGMEINPTSVDASGNDWLLTSGVLTIFSDTGMADWTSNRNTYGSEVTSVVIESGVTSISSAAFSGCTGLTGSLTIPSGVTTIGTQAFYGCTGLTGSLTIPAGVTFIGGNAFSGCTGFNGTLTIPASVTTIGMYAFYNCTNLTGITSGITDFTNIDAAAFNTIKDKPVTCEPALVQAHQTYGFTYVVGAAGATFTIGALTYTVLTAPVDSTPGTVSVKATDISTISGSLTLPGSVENDGKTYTVTIIEVNAFYGCTALTSLTLNTGLVTIGIAAFSGCTGLTGDLTIPSGVTTIGDLAFYNCSELTSLTLNAGLVTIGPQAFQGCIGLTGSLVIPSGVKSIGASAFYDCTGFNGTLTIPVGVTAIGMYAFYNCTNLTGITSGITDFTNINAAAFDTIKDKPVTCDPAYVQAHQTYGFTNVAGAVGGTFTIGALTYTILTAPADSTPGTVSVKATDKSTISGSLTLTGSVTDSGKTYTVTTIGTAAFSGCTGLTGSLTIPASVTTISGSAFFGCTGLTAVSLPSGLKSVSNLTFYDCTSLASVTLPEGLETIGDSAFQNCALTEVTIPYSVTSIGVHAFRSCAPLASIQFLRSTPPAFNNQAFFNIAQNLTVTVPVGCVSVYQATFGSYITTGTNVTYVEAGLVTLATQIIAIAAPVTDETPQSTIAAGTGYTGTISWNNGNPSIFAPSTAYTATVTLTSTTGYKWPATAPTITVAGSTSVGNYQITGGDVSGNILTFDVVFPATGAGLADITAATVSITAPVTGATPQSTITAGTGYTGTISWSGSPSIFAPSTTYTATVTLTSTTWYKWPASPTITVAGSTSVSNYHITGGDVSGNILTFDVVFPATGATAPGLSVNGGSPCMTVDAAQTAITTALVSNTTVTVTGSLSGADASLSIYIPAGKTVVWQADYSGSRAVSVNGYGAMEIKSGGKITSSTNGAALSVAGSASVIVGTDGSVENTSEDGMAITVSGSASLTVDGGTVTADRIAISPYGSATVTVKDGSTVENDNNLNATISLVGSAALVITGGTIKNDNISAFVVAIDTDSTVFVSGGNIAAGGIQRNSGATSAAGYYTGSANAEKFDTTGSTNKFTAGDNLFQLDGVNITANGTAHNGSTSTHYDVVAALSPKLDLTSASVSAGAYTPTVNTTAKTVTFTENTSGQQSVTLTVSGAKITSTNIVVPDFTTAAFPININRVLGGSVSITGASGAGGSAQVGDTLSADVSALTPAANDGRPTLVYQWQYSADGTTGWTNITGATGANYTVALDYSNKHLRVVVAATAASGFTGSLNTNALQVAKAAITGNVSINVGNEGGGTAGVAEAGDVLSVDISGIIPAAAQTGVTYQWSGGSGSTTNQPTYTVTAQDESNRATITVTVSAAATGDYTGSLQASVTAGRITVAINGLSIANSTYTGSAHPGYTGTATFTGGNPTNTTLTPSYAGRNSTTYGPSAAPPTNTGEYTVTLTLANDTLYYGTWSGNFSIYKATPTYTVPTGLTATYGQTLNDVSLPTGFTWNAPATSVGSVGNNTFQATYTPSDTNNYNTVTDVQITVAVNKANPTGVTFPTSATITYGQTLAQAQFSGESGAGTFAFTNGAIAPTVAQSGTAYQVTFTPTDSANYNTLTQNVNITVNKAPASSISAQTVKIYYAEASTGNEVNLAALLPATERATATYSVTSTNTLITGASVNASGVLAFDTAVASSGASENITINVTMDNYNLATITVTVEFVDKKVPVVTASVSGSLTYGQPLSALTISATAMVDGATPVTGSIAWDYPSSKPAVSAGAQGWTFTPTSATLYEVVTGSSPITVNKATPSGTPTSTSITQAGKTLADANLTPPTGGFVNPNDGTMTVPGTLAWNDGDGTTVTANAAYGWTFTPTDTANYNIRTGSFTPYAVIAQHTISYNANGGSGTMASDTVNDGNSYTIKANAFSRINHIFTGWNTQANGGGTAYAAGAIIPSVTANITLYAQWNYSGNGGGGGGSGSGSGGGGGGSSGGSTTTTTTTTTPTTTWLEQNPAGTLVNSANGSNQDYARTKSTGAYGVRKAAFAALAGLKYEHDTVADGAVQVRLYINDPANIKNDLMVSGYVKGSDVDYARNTFEKWFNNKVRAIHMDQTAPWGQPVQIAARIDLTGMDSKKLYFYSYDKKTNSYKRIEKPAYWIDKNGYLHFETELAGDIIISEGPLDRK